MKYLLKFIVIVFVLSSCAKAESDIVTLTGVIIDGDSGLPIQDVLVAESDALFMDDLKDDLLHFTHDYTDKEGRFTFYRDISNKKRQVVKVGSVAKWDLTVEKEGYEALVEFEHSYEGDDISTAFELTRYAEVHVVTYDDPSLNIGMILISGGLHHAPRGKNERLELNLDESANLIIRKGSEGEVSYYGSGQDQIRIPYNLRAGEVDTLRIGM